MSYKLCDQNMSGFVDVILEIMKVFLQRRTADVIVAILHAMVGVVYVRLLTLLGND